MATDHDLRHRHTPSFVLPESFDPGEFLRTPKLRSRFDDARYFISLILRKLARWDVDHLGLVRLHAKYLMAIMYQPTYAAVVQALVDGGAVERFPYQVGQRSFGFRLSAKFVVDKHVRTLATDPRLIRRLEKFSDECVEEWQARMKPVHHALAKQQTRLQIHGDRAREFLAALLQTENPFDSQSVLVGDIENCEYRLSVGQYGRVFNNISNLKSELRDELHVGGEKLGYVDLSCAQPAFLAKAMQDDSQDVGGTLRPTLVELPVSGVLTNGDRRQRHKTGSRSRQGAAGCSNYDSSLSEAVHYDSSRPATQNADFELYRSLVQRGELYEVLLADLGHSISRDELKRRFLADVIAKRKASFRGTEYPSLVEDRFRERFPTVYRFIRTVNCDGYEHSNIIRLLQRAESSFVIETVAADLLARHPQTFFLTLHDAIYTTAEHLPKVEQAFHRAFDQTNFPMTFKVTAPNSRRSRS